MKLSCVICLELFTQSCKISAVTKCGHLFHTLCLEDWLKVSQTCPKCRVAVQGSSDYMKIYHADCIVSGDGAHEKKYTELMKRISNLEEELTKSKKQNETLVQSVAELTAEVTRKKGAEGEAAVLRAAVTEALRDFNAAKDATQDAIRTLLTANVSGEEVEEVVKEHQNNPSLLQMICLLNNKLVQEFAGLHFALWNSLRGKLKFMWDGWTQTRTEAMAAANRAFWLEQEATVKLQALL